MAGGRLQTTAINSLLKGGRSSDCFSKLLGSRQQQRSIAAKPKTFDTAAVAHTDSSSSADADAAYPKQSDFPHHHHHDAVDSGGVPTSGISRPLSEILKELNKKVPDSLISARTEPNGFSVKYIPWHIVNRILNLHAPEWSGEVRSITYSADGKSVSVIYRVTLYGTDAEIYRESTGTASVGEPGYGDAVQKAEAMAFRRACARFGLGLHLYHEDAL
ncbi:DNA repair RAD52-like protein 1, mitochondrial [Coffea arabica]|uniref:DNA repair RAD52-like protein 1, mitochondrial n=1 Tax=Coffea arabica TaxID=13443 RepID=A0A6P6UM84_COFAR|nr:DNA repair RAD52-like protein 1, mitochondrial isoform X1 [Coffea arabica]